MKIIFLLPLLATTITLSDAGLLNGGHFIPATNVVSSRTIVGGAIGGGPTSGFSTAQYSQTVAAPATVHTVITSSHPGNNLAPSSGSGANQNGVGNGAHVFGNYAYNSGPAGGSTQASGSGSGGYGGNAGHGGAGQSSGYGQSQAAYYNHNQRYY